MISNFVDKDKNLIKLLLRCLHEIDSLNSSLYEVRQLRNDLINKSEMILKKSLSLVLIGNSQKNKINFLNKVLFHYSNCKYKEVFNNPFKEDLHSIKLIDNSDNPQFTVKVEDQIERNFNDNQLSELRDHLISNETKLRHYFLEKIKVPNINIPFKILQTPNLSYKYFNEISVKGIFKAHLPLFILINDEKNSFYCDIKCKLDFEALNNFPIFLIIVNQDGFIPGEEILSSFFKEYVNIKVIATHSINYSNDEPQNKFFLIDYY